jgi:hypothetical protein
MPEWTDDLTVPLPPGRTVAELVDVAVRAASDATPGVDVVRLLASEFALSLDDANFAYDRFCGGLVRAATRNPLNCPPSDKDPVAYESFHRGMADPSLIARVYPQFAPKE